MITSDCIIIGGGIVGMLSARELALHGFKTSIIDAHAAGRQCSWAGGGILAPLYPWQMAEDLQVLCAWSQRQYPALSEELHAATGIDPELWQCGMLVHAGEELVTAVDWAKRKNIMHQVLEPGQVPAFAPALDRQQASLLWFPEQAQVRNPRLLSALKANLQQLGVNLYEHTEVRRIRVRQQQVQAVETTRGDFSAPVTVIASGAWTSQLWPEINVKPVRGQMLCYQADRNFIQTMVLKDGRYVIPRRDGHVLVGSTVEDVGFDSGTTREARDALVFAAEDMLPGINKFPLQGHWAGLRPATPRGFPCIGAWPETEGLFLNTGHNRNGIVLAPGSARLLLDSILQREPTLPGNVFQPSGSGITE